MNRINLTNSNIRTDLVLENMDKSIYCNNIKEDIIDNIKITSIKITKDINKNLNKKEGNYITLEFLDITNFEDREKIGKCLENEIRKIIELNNIKNGDECLIVGLGNKKSTPDSLGPKVIENILVTRHLFELKTNVKSGIRKVSALSPGVMADSGIETFDILESIVKKIKPKFLIVIDALAAGSIERINKTIQLSDTGITPGSGVLNHRKELSKDTLGIPVISIGIPTVVSSAVIVDDTINYLFRHISYIKNNYYENKLVLRRNNKYIDKLKNSELSQKEKTKISGIIGELSNNEKRDLINEVLDSINYNLIVTPKEMDFLIDKLSNVISSSLNNALHKSVNNY